MTAFQIDRLVPSPTNSPLIPHAEEISVFFRGQSSPGNRRDTSPRQRVVIETAPTGTVFEDINENIGTVTRHGEHLTWARMYLHDGCWQDPEVVACYVNCVEVLPLKFASFSPPLP